MSKVHITLVGGQLAPMYHGIVATVECNAQINNGMMTFSLQDNHLGMSDEKALHLLLDTELFNINVK